MIHEVTMPAMGADMTEGTVVKWLKSEGDDVARGDKLAEIETDKTVVEMEAYNAGILRRIVLGDGTRAPVGSLLAYIGDADDELPETADDSADMLMPRTNQNLKLRTSRQNPNQSQFPHLNPRQLLKSRHLLLCQPHRRLKADGSRRHRWHAVWRGKRVTTSLRSREPVPAAE